MKIWDNWSRMKTVELARGLSPVEKRMFYRRCINDVWGNFTFRKLP